MRRGGGGGGLGVIKKTEKNNWMKEFYTVLKV